MAPNSGPCPSVLLVFAFEIWTLSSFMVVQWLKNANGLAPDVALVYPKGTQKLSCHSKPALISPPDQLLLNKLECQTQGLSQEMQHSFKLS